jgi:drug/metabolite transporter (DMT)-like permease
VSEKHRAKSFLAHAGLVYAAAIWGSTFIIVKSSLESIDPVILVGYRFTIAALLMAALLVIRGYSLFKDILKGIWLGFLLWLLYVPQTIGLKYTTASNSAFITGLFVAFVPLFSLLLFRKIPARRDLVAIAISITGLWFLTGGLVEANTGDLLTLITAMTYAVHVLFVDRCAKSGMDPYVMAFQQFLFVGLASLVTGLLLHLPFSVGTGGTLGAVIFLALLPTLSAFVIQMVAQKIVAAVRVSLIFALEPVFAAVFAWTVGGEHAVPQRMIGGLLIVAAMVVSAVPPGKFRFKRLHL